MNVTKPDITRLARTAGVKSISEDCYDVIRHAIDREVRDVVRAAIIINSEHQTKTLMGEDVYEAIAFRGKNLAQSSEVGVSTCSK